MARVAPWTDIEGHLGLWTACFPALQPLIRLASYKLGLRSTLSSTAKRSRTAGASSGAPKWLSSGSHHRSGLRSHGYMSFSSGDDFKVEDTRSAVVVGGGTGTGLDGVSATDLELRDLEAARILDRDGGEHTDPARNVIFKRTDVKVQIVDARDHHDR